MGGSLLIDTHTTVGCNTWLQNTCKKWGLAGKQQFHFMRGFKALTFSFPPICSHRHSSIQNKKEQGLNLDFYLPGESLGLWATDSSGGLSLILIRNSFLSCIQETVSVNKNVLQILNSELYTSFLIWKYPVLNISKCGTSSLPLKYRAKMVVHGNFTQAPLSKTTHTSWVISCKCCLVKEGEQHCCWANICVLHGVEFSWG